MLSDPAKDTVDFSQFLNLIHSHKSNDEPQIEILKAFQVCLTFWIKLCLYSYTPPINYKKPLTSFLSLLDKSFKIFTKFHTYFLEYFFVWIFLSLSTKNYFTLNLKIFNYKHKSLYSNLQFFIFLSIPNILTKCFKTIPYAYWKPMQKWCISIEVYFVWKVNLLNGQSCA